MIGKQMSNHTSNFNVIYAINQSLIFMRLVMDLYSPNSANLNLFTVVTLTSFTQLRLKYRKSYIISSADFFMYQNTCRVLSLQKHFLTLLYLLKLQSFQNTVKYLTFYTFSFHPVFKQVSFVCLTQMAVRGLTLSNERLYVGKKDQSGSRYDIRLAKSFSYIKVYFFSYTTITNIGIKLLRLKDSKQNASFLPFNDCAL